MALTINTNLSSLIVQKNLNDATNLLNRSIERMTTGYKINSAKDDAAGYSIMTNWSAKLSSWEIAAQNANMGLDLLTTTEENYGLITSHLQRVRDLTEQAANGTYGEESLNAIKAEITARLTEVDRIAANAEYNGIKLMSTSATNINLQIGVSHTATESQIQLAASLFSDACTSALFGTGNGAADVATSCTAADAGTFLETIDTAIKTINSRVTDIGSAQNRVESAAEAIAVQIENLTSSLSTIRDSDVANESSTYIQAQILQQASATLLATANQTPSIALTLI